METQFDFRMYFPAAPLSSLSDPVEYKRLPLRNHVYLGETVHFLLVLRFRNAAETDGGPSWKDLASSLSILTSATTAESRRHRPEPEPEQPHCEDVEEGAETPDGAGEENRTFRACEPLLSHQCWSAAETRLPSPLVMDDQLIFCLTVSLDQLPVNTVKAKIVVTVWKEEERPEVREHDYLTLLQLKSPVQTFRSDRTTFKTQVSTALDVLPPPSVRCQQMTVAGKHLTILKVLNHSSQDEMCIRDVKILPNYNSAYLPIMPDGSVLIVDSVCHQSAEVTMTSFSRIDGKSSRSPVTLSFLEEQNFMFQLQLQEMVEEDSCEGLEVPLLAVLQWSSPSLPVTRCISTCYSLPSICLDSPRLVMTASCPSTVRPLESFLVTYTLLNNLQDFLAVCLIWNSDADSGLQGSGGAVVCQSPLNNLGQCRKGSIISFTMAFQILRTGLFEVAQRDRVWGLKRCCQVSGRSPVLRRRPHPPPTGKNSQERL
ncbi:trafficking protein particle complex subunit 14 isoform 2-T2 [Pholidichthys leucotaenia]